MPQSALTKRNQPFRCFKIYLRIFFCVALTVFGIFTSCFAEGSKELNAHGGARAYLFSSTTVSNRSFPFPTLGTMKVFAKVGESIYVGSSAQGASGGTINLRAPDGNTYTSGTNATTGLIVNRAQEVAGPLPNAGGYTPFIKTVLAGQQGVWEIEFIAENPGNDLNGNPPTVAASDNWTQPVAEYITALPLPY